MKRAKIWECENSVRFAHRPACAAERSGAAGRRLRLTVFATSEGYKRLSKLLTGCLCVLLCVLFPCSLCAQKRWLQGEVVNIGENSEKNLEVGITVTMKETGDSDTTNSHGIFKIFLKEIFKSGEKVTLLIDKPDWRIQYPLDGEARIPENLEKELVEVRLLPVGSKLFWTNDRIEKFIQDVAEKSKEQVKPEGKPEELDFSRYIKDWAVQYGFSAQEAKAEIDKWIAEIEENQNDFYKLGLAAFAKKNFSEAAKLFKDSGEHKAKQLEQIIEQERKLTEEVVRDFRLEGKAHYSNYLFDKALIAYERAMKYVSKEQTPQLWAATSIDIGNANWGLGIRTEGPVVQRYLTAAVQAYNQAFEVYTRDTLPQQWATTQNNLGSALQEQGIRTGGEEGRRLLAEAVKACRLALEVYTRDTLPQDWAMTQNNLGIALQEQGIRTGGEEGAKLLAEAVEACRLALEVYTRDTLPQDWAMTQNNLGNALSDRGIRTGGEKGAKLLAEAVEAYRRALEIRTRDNLPQDWVMTQNNLGSALKNQGVRTGGEEGAKLLAEVIDAYRRALEVRTRENLPQGWATTQNNLGSALQDQGIRTDGEEGAKLLAEAVEAYRRALEVRTRDTLPQQWAMTQNNLGIALQYQGIRTDGEEGAKLLAEAVEAYRQALEVYTRETLPQGWATTQNNLGIALQEQATRTGGEEGGHLLAAAIATFKQALEVRTYEHLPLDWAQTQNNLAKAYAYLEDLPNVAECYANILKVYPDDKKAYQTAGYLYHEVLFQFPKAFALNQKWIERHPNDLSALSDFAEKHFTTARFAECEERIAALLANPEVEPNVKIALQAIEIANLLALHKAEMAPSKMDTLIEAIANQPEDFKVGWTFEGTKHFISQNENLVPYREWLLGFFKAVESKDRNAILTALQEAQKNFQAMAEENRRR